MIGKIAFKQKELLLLAQLRKNSRVTLTELSKAIDMPISTIHDKLKLKTREVIKKHTCILDYSKLGFNTTATILLRVKKEQKNELGMYLKKNFNVNSLYKINANYDFLIEVIFKNMKELEAFVEEVEERFKIKKKEIFYMIDELAKEQFLDEKEKLVVLEE